ncbi:MAG: VIT1/CCC1 transporter family protein [Chloroflexi bacterium]|nr:VIT1/CCC1 transporter family protein [Chloroflexota bacterium]
MVESPDITPSPKRLKQYRDYLEAELEAAAMYRAMAEVEPDAAKAEVFGKLVEAEMRHASRWAEKLGLDLSQLQPSGGGLKLGLYRKGASMFGTSRVIPWLLRGEAKDVAAYASDPEAKDFATEERRHARALRQMAAGVDPMEALRGERWHRFSGSGGSLRAAVLGVNDGLVSNFGLVMGVAGGTDQASFILLAGVAGLLAGAFSMAAGEYVSVRSQRDVYEYQIDIEAAELEEFPEEEEEELVLIYQAKGLSEEEAKRVAGRIMTNPQVALDTMAREELGLDPQDLGSPWGAAISSFTAFVGGAIVPIIPYIFHLGSLAFVLSAVLSVIALALVGGTLALASGRSMYYGAIRMLLAGGAAAAVTFVIGSIIGVTIAG